jgi:hypothetical protein
MSNKSKRPRPMQPHEWAQIDQATATARDDATTAGVIVIDYADPGIRCCWCDCPGLHRDPISEGCPGCQRDALHIVHVLYGTPWQISYPVCEHHFSDFVRTQKKTLTEAGVRYSNLKSLDDPETTITIKHG